MTAYTTTGSPLVLSNNRNQWFFDSDPFPPSPETGIDSSL